MEGILAHSPEASKFYRHESVPHRAITRLFYGLAANSEDQKALATAVVDVLDHIMPIPVNAPSMVPSDSCHWSYKAGERPETLTKDAQRKCLLGLEM